MQTQKSRKINQILAWVLLLVGMVLAAHGLLKLAGGDNSQTGQATVGGIMMMVSGLFFALSRRKIDAAPAPKE